ncbi:unnamed protein product [Colias eurytheme]|nr:unnamed protein product [Colias eurytheme]
MYLWVYCIFVIIFLFLGKRHIRRYVVASRIYSSKKNLPLIGVAHHFSGDTESIMKSLAEVSTECSENGGILRAWLGPLLYIVTTDPGIMDVILKHHLDKDDVIKVLHTGVGNGSLFAPGPIWKPRRKVMLSVLNPKVLTSFFDDFVERGKKFAQDLSRISVGNEPLNMWPLLNAYSFDIIWETTIGKSSIDIDDYKETFLESINQVKDYLTTRIFHFWLQPDCIFRLHPNYAKVESIKKSAYAFLDMVVRKKRSEFKEQYDVTNKSLSQNEKSTLFNLFIFFSRRDNNEYNDLVMQEELLALFLAATETCTNAVCVALKLLAKYPQVQEKVYAELCAAFQDQDMLPNNKEDLGKLEYLERVIYETLRLYPPAPCIIRKTNKDVEFPDGITIPEDTAVLISIWGLHRNKKYWGSDADCFDPDRFLPERYTQVPPGCYIPFIAGPRNCPGYSYAMMSMKTTLCVLLKNFRVLPEPEDGPIPHIRVKFDVTMSVLDDKVALAKR